MKRRKFLSIIFFSFLLLFFSTYLLLKKKVVYHSIVYLIEKHYGFLKINKQCVESFANDYVKHVELDTLSYLKLTALILFLKHPMENLRVFNILLDFIRSTDFFQNGLDTSKEVNYLGFRFYDTHLTPYTSPCYNPFSERFHAV